MIRLDAQNGGQARRFVAGLTLPLALAAAVSLSARHALAQEARAPAEGHGPLAPPPPPGAPPAPPVGEHGEPAEHGGHAEEGPHYVFGIGGTFGWDLGEKRVNPGGIAFFEFEAIEHWLSIAAEVAFAKVADGEELTSAILFKKPFKLGRNVEMLVGIGPEAVQTIGTVPSATYFGVEGVIDFVFWPSKHFGAWVAPTYELVFKDKASGTYGLTLGPAFTWW